jgi:hypothetical protein
MGARPTRFTGRDKKQWEKFKSLPNLIYTDGNEWTLFRAGETTTAQTIRLAGDVTSDGANAITAENVAALETMLRDFLSWQPIVPSRPRELAKLLAPLCRLIREDVKTAIAEENSGLSLLAAEWRSALFPDADDARFADAYAQTLTYGLLLARVEGQNELDLNSAANALETNHGLLAGALRVLGQPDARRELGAGLDVLLRVLNALNPDVWRQSPAGDTDPWLYFYEDFLAEYDRRLRDDAGVYYTPVQVIRAQVRLIEEVLRTRFGKARGFNAPGVTVLDPAAGTGAYPLAILEHALAASHARSGPGAVAGAATDLASRLHAFEFLVGPYAVAHLRLTQAVRAAGGHLPAEGAEVFLCDTLESPQAAPPQPSLFVRRLAEEHERARRIKDSRPILVCLGNPPYDRQQRDDTNQTRRGGWVRFGDGSTPAPLEDFLAPAREAGYGGHLKNLYNDYVYFWRWALWKVFEKEAPGRAPGGIVCFITASSYLRGPGFVGMRRVMRETFDELWILDLEGDNRGARPTENVFSIQTGVAIALGIRTGPPDASTPARVHYAKIQGTRAQKYAALDNISSLSDLAWQECPTDWLKPFLPISDADYWQWPEIINLFPWQHSGVEFKRTWPIAPTAETLERRWQSLLSSPSEQRAVLFRETPDRRINQQYLDMGSSGQRMPTVSSLQADAPPQRIERYAFRSFDRQYVLRDGRLCARPRPPLWNSYSPNQIFMVSFLTEVLGNGPAAVLSTDVPDRHYFRGSFGGKHVIPFWRDAAATRPNVTHGVLATLSETYDAPVRAQDLFAYCYALLSTRSYVENFAEELLLPGPRIPLTRSFELFARVASLGHELIRLHTFGERDLENDAPAGEVTTGAARNVTAVSPQPEQYPEDYAYDESTQTLRVGDGEFAPVAPEVWTYSVSGLSVVKSWLDYRKKEPNGRSSSALDEIRPESWSAALTEELLEVLWTLEHTLDREPDASALLDEVLAGDLIAAEELPQPQAEETQPPVEDENENTAQQTMAL